MVDYDIFVESADALLLLLCGARRGGHLAHREILRGVWSVPWLRRLLGPQFHLQVTQMPTGGDWSCSTAQGHTTTAGLALGAPRAEKEGFLACTGESTSSP